MHGVFGILSTPNYSAPMRSWQGKLKETLVTVMGEIAGRPFFHGFIRPGLEGASMVTTLQMMILVTVMMMLVMATLAMWDLWDLWGL